MNPIGFMPFFFFIAGPVIHHFHICWHYLAPSSLVFYSDYRSSKPSFCSKSFILIPLFYLSCNTTISAQILFLAISLSWEFSLTLVWSFTNSLQISFTQCQIHCLSRKALYTIISRKYNQQSMFSNYLKFNNNLHSFSSQETNMTSLNQDQSDQQYCCFSYKLKSTQMCC